MIKAIKKISKLAANTKQPIMTQLAQLYQDLENIFKTALAEGSFTVALRAKELQLKKLLSLASHEQQVIDPQKSKSHNILEFLEHCSEDDLNQITQDLISINNRK